VTDKNRLQKMTLMSGMSSLKHSNDSNIEIPMLIHREAIRKLRVSAYINYYTHGAKKGLQKTAF